MKKMPSRINVSKKSKDSFSKIVTIKGIDKQLFEQFVSLTLAWGKNTGEIFSAILNNYLKNGGGAYIYLPAIKKRLEGSSFQQLEIIENIDELFVAEKDLRVVPKGVMFYFYNVKKLIFSDEIDSQILLRYIYRIKNCSTQKPSQVKKLAFLSLLHNYPSYFPKGRLYKDVTIRNVLIDTWNNFKAYCQLNGMNIGTIINQILWEIIPEIEITQILFSVIKDAQKNILLISSQREVTIKQEDLLEITPQQVLFHRIENLIFLEDISVEVFVKRVNGIYNCASVKFPKQFPKLLKLSRVKRYPQ